MIQQWIYQHLTTLAAIITLIQPFNGYSPNTKIHTGQGGVLYEHTLPTIYTPVKFGASQQSRGMFEVLKEI
jgi:hypothetical protein